MTAPHARLTFTTTTGNSKKQKLPPNRLNLAIVPFHSFADQPEGTCPAAFTSLTLRTRAINSFVANNGPAIDYNIVIRKRNQQKRNEQNVKTHCWFHCALILHKAMHWSLFHFTLIFVINSFVLFCFILFTLACGQVRFRLRLWSLGDIGAKRLFCEEVKDEERIVMRCVAIVLCFKSIVK